MAERTLKQKTISGMLWASIQKFGTLGITFISNIILARILTPEDYGLIGMLAIFIAISNALIDGGFGSALIQKSRPTKTDYSSVFYFNLFLSLILYLLLYFFAPSIENFYHNIGGLALILRVQGIVLIINAFTIVQFNQLRKKMDFKLLSRINISSAVFSMMIAILMAYYGLGVWSLVFQQITFSVVNTILLWYYCRWIPLPIFSWSSIKQLFGFGSYIMVSGILNTIGNNLNSLLIGKFFNPSTLGYFTQAKKIEDASSMGILTVVEQVTYPMLVEVKHDKSKMSSVLAKFNNLLLLLVYPIMYCIILSSKSIIFYLFGEKWIESAPILQVLAIHGIFLSMQGSNYNAIAAIGKSKTLFNWTIIKRIVNILFLLVSLYVGGFLGLLWGIVATGFFIAVCNMYLVDRYVGFSLLSQIKCLMPVTMISTIPFLCCFLIENNICTINEHNNIEIVMSVIYLFVYILLTLSIPLPVLNEIRNEIRGLIRKH